MAWLYKSWPAAGSLFLIIIFTYVLLISPYKFFSIQSAGWINLAILMLHQFEEFIYPGGFKDFFNSSVQSKSGPVKFELNNKSAFHVNVTLGWTAYLIGAIMGPYVPLYLMILLVITFANGVVHTAAALFLRKYNPGSASGFFVFIPFASYSMANIVQSGLVSSGEWITIILCALAGMLTIPLTLFIFKEKHVINN